MQEEYKFVSADDIGTLRLQVIKMQERERYNSELFTDKLKISEERKKMEEEREEFKSELKASNEFINRMNLEMNKLKNDISKMHEEFKRRLALEKEFLSAQFSIKNRDTIEENKTLKARIESLDAEAVLYREEIAGLKGRLKAEEKPEGQANASEGTPAVDTASEISGYKAEIEELKKLVELMRSEKQVTENELKKELEETKAGYYVKETQYDLRVKRANDDKTKEIQRYEDEVNNLRTELLKARESVSVQLNAFTAKEKDMTAALENLNSEVRRLLDDNQGKTATIMNMQKNLRDVDQSVEAIKTAYAAEAERLNAELIKKEAKTVEEMDKSERLTAELRRSTADRETKLNEERSISDQKLKGKEDIIRSLNNSIAELERSLRAREDEAISVKQALDKEKEAQASMKRELEELRSAFARLDQEYRGLFRKCQIFLAFKKPVSINAKT